MRPGEMRILLENRRRLEKDGRGKVIGRRDAGAGSHRGKAGARVKENSVQNHEAGENGNRNLGMHRIGCGNAVRDHPEMIDRKRLRGADIAKSTSRGAVPCHFRFHRKRHRQQA